MWLPSLSYEVTDIATSLRSGYSSMLQAWILLHSSKNYLEKEILNCNCPLVGKHTYSQEDLEVSIEMFERMKLLLLIY